MTFFVSRISVFAALLALTPLFLSSPSPSLAQQDDEPLPVVKLSPAMREVPQNPYAELPCDRLASVTAQSEREQAQLQARKRECLQRYQQFIPADGVRR